MDLRSLRAGRPVQTFFHLWGKKNKMTVIGGHHPGQGGVGSGPDFSSAKEILQGQKRQKKGKAQVLRRKPNDSGEPPQNGTVFGSKSQVRRERSWQSSASEKLVASYRCPGKTETEEGEEGAHKKEERGGKGARYSKCNGQSERR